MALLDQNCRQNLPLGEDEGGPNGTLAEQVFHRLSAAILSGELAPGTKISEPALARQYGVSRGPLREALHRLQERKLITRSANQGPRVVKPSAEALAELFVVREALEGMAARLAAENAGQLDLVQLRAVLHDAEAALAGADRDAVRNYAGEFQLAVFKAAHNDFLFDLLKSLQEKIRNQRTSTISVPGRDEEVVTFCRDVLRAIEAHDPDAAERIARANRQRTLELRLKMMRHALASR